MCIRDSAPSEVNVLRLLFDPANRAMIGDWEVTARTVLRRFQREVLQRPHDIEMAALLEELTNTHGLPADWRQPDPSAPDDPMLGLEFRSGDIGLRFLTTMTEFNAPQNVTLDELRIESYFPIDDETRELCVALLA